MFCEGGIMHLLVLPIFIIFCIVFMIVYILIAKKLQIKQRVIIFGGFVLIVGAFCIFGGNYYRVFPLYSEVYIEHPDFIKLDYIDRPEWWDYPTLATIRKNINDYLEQNPDIASNISATLKNLSIKKASISTRLLRSYLRD